MKFRCPHFRSGVALTCLIAVFAINLSHLAWLNQVGVLALALMLGVFSRAVLHIPELQETGIHFSARELLRIGTVLIGVKCNFSLLVHAGPRMMIVAASVVLGGLLFITLLGRAAGLSETLSLLLAVDTSICGASAVASLAPTLSATKEEVALAIPLGSLIGTIGLLFMTAATHFFSITPISFGVFAGASLQEVAQVVAAVSSFPASMNAGITTKFLRILLLAPTILGLGFFLMKRGLRRGSSPREEVYTFVSAVWFVIGFFIVGMVHTQLEGRTNIFLMARLDQSILSIATFLMAVAMAGVGLQVRLESLFQKGGRVIGVAFAGWLFLIIIAGLEIFLFQIK